MLPMKIGEHVCKICRGLGYIKLTYRKPFEELENMVLAQCAQCKATGKVDWILHARGQGTAKGYAKYIKKHFDLAEVDVEGVSKQYCELNKTYYVEADADWGVR